MHAMGRSSLLITAAVSIVLVLPCEASGETCEAVGGQECVSSLIQKTLVGQALHGQIPSEEISDLESISLAAMQTPATAYWSKHGDGECDGIDPEIEKLRRISQDECQRACEDNAECNFYGHSSKRCFLYRHCHGMVASRTGAVTYRHPDEGACNAPYDRRAQGDSICCQGDVIQTGGRCTPFCKEGFSPTINEVRCSRGQLHPSGLKCKPDSCLAPIRIRHAHPKGTCEEGASVKHRRRCTVQCAKGFMPTVESLKCRKGSFRPSTVACVPINANAVEANVATPPNQMKGLLPPFGGWRGSTQLQRFRVNGFPCHLYRYYWSSGNRLKDFELDFVTAGGIIWFSVQPKDWKEAASTAYKPVLNELCDLVSSLAPAQVMISAGHEPDRHCSICPNTKEVWGTIDDYNAMGRAFRKQFERKGVKNVIWIANFAGTQDVELFQKIVIPMWPGDGVLGWLFFNQFQLGGHMDKGGGPLVTGVARTYSNFETYSAPGHNFKAVPWGLGAWAVNHKNEHCDMASYLYSAKTTIEGGQYPRLQAAVYFDSKDGMMLDELRPVYKQYLAMDFFTVNDKHLPGMLGCDAPAKGACKEGDKVSSGGVCTAQCSDGEPSLPSLSCFNGVLSPPSFSCAGSWSKVGMGTCVRTGFVSQDNTDDQSACQASCMNDAECGAFCFSETVKPFCTRHESCPQLALQTKSGKDRSTHTCYVPP